MFSASEKHMIAQRIEDLLLSLNHPEMPKKRPVFQLQVKGAESWSWAVIDPNWAYKNKPARVNPWNEIARGVMEVNPRRPGGGKNV